jgi:hypothetical protein
LKLRGPNGTLLTEVSRSPIKIVTSFQCELPDSGGSERLQPERFGA